MPLTLAKCWLALQSMRDSQRNMEKFLSISVFTFKKIIPDGLTQPRAELFATTMITHTGEIIRRAFQSNYKERVKLSDSQVTLFSIINQDKRVK